MTLTAPETSPVSPPETMEPPRYRRPLGIGREQLTQYGVILLLAVLVLAPVVPTLYQSVIDRPLYESGGIFTTDGYVRLFTDAGFGEVIVNTVYFAGLTTVLALLIA